MKTYFMVERSPIYNKYMVYPKHENLPFHGTEGSYFVICARLFNLPYVSYLRMCRDVYGAKLIGKKNRYVSVVFDDLAAAQKLCKDLNMRARVNLDE